MCSSATAVPSAHAVTTTTLARRTDMDPNATLRLMREALTMAQMHEDHGDPGLAQEMRAEVAEHAQNLDEWLSKGGFLPADWQR